MVSIPSLHFFRWTDQLKDSGFEVFWFDITGMADHSNKIPWVKQYVRWKLRVNYPGRIKLKKNAPSLYRSIQKLNERNTKRMFERVLNIVKPDVVHSFALQLACLPILPIMNKNKVNWIYSSWGSDLFNRKGKLNYETDLKTTLERVNYLITDCKRDLNIALHFGFQGRFLGVFPGGGGFEIEKLNSLILPPFNRKIILVKGYENSIGKALNVIRALEKIKSLLKKYQIVVFGAENLVVDYIIRNNLFNEFNLQVYESRNALHHDEVLNLMGKALIYIGNSNSDGIPNTLLEAIVMGAFPIQSNPGGVTQELITHRQNGLLIDDYSDVEGIKNLILQAVNDQELISQGFFLNQNKTRIQYEKFYLTEKLLRAYKIATNENI